jgi:ketosteroid isomerase-like protein
MKSRAFLFLIFATISAAMPAQSRTDALSSRAAIDAGNQAWIDGIKAGDIKRIGATYAEDAIDCGPTGRCVRGRVQIERHMAGQLASLGRARSAVVNSWGTTERGNFVYEWGQAEAGFEGGKTFREKYLTVWQRQSDGTWKIFRNLVLP